MLSPFYEINKLLYTSNHFYTIAVDLNSTYSYVSPNYDKNFSFGKGTLLGQHFSVTLHPDDLDICAAAGGKCLEHPDQLVPVMLRKHDGMGGYVSTQWEMQAIIGHDQVPTGIFCIGYNITELVNVRDKLGYAETQLEEISFVQSHNVRRPLANILGLTDMLDKGLNISENAQIVKMLITSAKELDNVIRDITAKSAM